jgi:myo-inositol-1(or 4)-monophosphatase
LPVPDADNELLIRTLREAGGIAREFFGGRYKTFRKAGGDPVTEADLAIDAFLKQHLTAARPDYGWLSEESADDRSRLSSARSFVVDPIDGTYGFVKHRPQFTIVAAVVEAGRPVAAAVYNPITEEMYEASAGWGARKDGVPIRVSQQGDLPDARLLATRFFLEPSQWDTPWPENIRIETRASIAYRMALVAEGAFDAMISLSKKSDWDLAAADLIVHEAGGRVTTAEGERLIYNREKFEQGSVIAAPPELHGRLLAKLREYRPPEGAV